jgi:hypothetical protein
VHRRLLDGRRSRRRGGRREIDEADGPSRTAPAAARPEAVVAATEHHLHAEAADQQQDDSVEQQ